MDGATLQAKIYNGYAKAAQIIGLTFNLYRPLSAGSPLGNLVGTLKAALDSGPAYSFKSPNEYGDPTWFALINDATAQTGDYLVNANGTYFIAGKQFLLPVIVVECNRSVRISRQTMSSAVGAVGYSGTTAAGETNILGAAGNLWPASIMFGGKAQGAIGLPADSKQSGWRILLPPSVPGGVVLTASDIVTDDIGRRYVIDGAELTDLGWRINANELHT
jgi:hypothetical protein